MVDARELNGAGAACDLVIHPLDRQVEIEKQRPFRISPNHALNPEERRDTRASRHRADVVQTGRRGRESGGPREFYAVRAVRVVDHQVRRRHTRRAR